MSAESKFNEIVESFKKEIAEASRDAIEGIHSEMLPYVNDDTENNAVYRANDIVNQILTSNYTLEGDKIICNGWNTKLTANDHDRLVNKLAAKCSDVAAQKKIERLERQLKDAYNRT
jgi:molecular chaperone GrpE (heat shock protein)